MTPLKIGHQVDLFSGLHDLKGKHEASANAFHCKEHFHGAYVCLVGTFQAEIE